MANSWNDVFYDDTVINDHGTVSQWLACTQFIHHRRLHHLVVSLDVEWWRGVQYPVAVLQICVGRRCLIYQMLYSKYIPRSLVRFISNPHNTFVGVGVKDDLIKLYRDYGFGDHAQFLDLRELAASAYDKTELRQARLKSLANLEMGKEMEKPKHVTLSRWDHRWLKSGMHAWMRLCRLKSAWYC